MHGLTMASFCAPLIRNQIGIDLRLPDNVAQHERILTLLRNSRISVTKITRSRVGDQWASLIHHMLFLTSLLRGNINATPLHGCWQPWGRLSMYLSGCPHSTQRTVYSVPADSLTCRRSPVITDVSSPCAVIQSNRYAKSTGMQ